MRRLFALLAVALAAVPMAGCELLGIDSPEKVAASKEAEGKAIGSACRHAVRAIEDCYALNPKAQKAAVFAGWREMDEYMRENKLEGVAPTLARGAIKASPTAEAAGDDAKAERPAGKAGSKSSRAHDA
ncbi:hypothetical protein [Methylibium rhizosphaerae]|uniref:hypothetical protein n=1 Tax=Methylibium rhizosphaerae TaxID=2570323 RepID=UPI0011260AA8|nr:hypothetical protein [Methylibium rhizosphaerae]